MAEWFLTVKRAFPGDFLYLDVGANIGIHGLHAAKAGATVWAVEPQAKNLQKARIRYFYFSIIKGSYSFCSFLRSYSLVQVFSHCQKLCDTLYDTRNMVPCTGKDPFAL